MPVAVVDLLPSEVFWSPFSAAEDQESFSKGEKPQESIKAPFNCPKNGVKPVDSRMIVERVIKRRPIVRTESAGFT